MSEYLSPQEEFVKSLPNLETTEEFKEFLDTVIETQRRAEEIQEEYPTINPAVPLIFGKPGMGKSSLVEEFARENGYVLVEVNASRDIDERFRGIPYPLEKKSRKKGETPVEMIWVSSDVLTNLWKAYDEMEERKKKGEDVKGIILFIDDMHYAAEDLAPILHELLTNKKIAGRPVPPHTYIVLASNYGDATNAQSIASTIMTRVLPVRFEPPDKEAYLNYEKFAREIMAGKYNAISLTGLGFFEQYKEIFTQKEEMDKMTGTTRTVNYFLMTLKTLEDKLEKGEISSETFRRRVKEIVGYLPSEYQDKFLRYYFSVKDLDITEYVEKGKKVVPQELAYYIEKKLKEKELSPEEEPINIYVKATMTQYVRTLVEKYVVDIREASKKGEKELKKVYVDYAEKFKKIGDFYNRVKEEAEKSGNTILKKIAAGIWDSLTATAVAEMRLKVDLAEKIYTFAAPDHPDKVMLEKVSKMTIKIGTTDPKLKEIIDFGNLEYYREFNTVPPGVLAETVFPVFLYFLYRVPLIKDGEEKYVGEVIGSELLIELVEHTKRKINEINMQIQEKKDKELPDEIKKLRRKYNSMRL